MKLRRIILLGVVAWVGTLFYYRFSAVSNISGGFSTPSSTTTTSTKYAPTGGGLSGTMNSSMVRGDSIGRVGGAGQVGSHGLRFNLGDNFLRHKPSVSSGEGVQNGILLLTAVSEGKEQEVARLLREKTKVDMRDNDQRTPLMYASWNGYNAICVQLLTAKANTHLRDSHGHSAYDYAAGRGLYDTVKLLLKHSGDTDEKHYLEYARIMQAALAGNLALMPEGKGKLASINRISPEGQSPLHLAASGGNLPLAEALLSRGAKASLVTPSGQTPLHWAAWNNQSQMITLLLSKGAKASAEDAGGNTPLMLAAENNGAEAVRALLQAGVEKDVYNKEGKTALSIAQAKGNQALTALLQ